MLSDDEDEINSARSPRSPMKSPRKDNDLKIKNEDVEEEKASPKKKKGLKSRYAMQRSPKKKKKKSLEDLENLDLDPASNPREGSSTLTDRPKRGRSRSRPTDVENNDNKSRLNDEGSAKSRPNENGPRSSPKKSPRKMRTASSSPVKNSVNNPNESPTKKQR